MRTDYMERKAELMEALLVDLDLDCGEDYTNRYQLQIDRFKGKLEKLIESEWQDRNGLQPEHILKILGGAVGIWAETEPAYPKNLVPYRHDMSGEGGAYILSVAWPQALMITVERDWDIDNSAMPRFEYIKNVYDALKKKKLEKMYPEFCAMAEDLILDECENGGY